MDSQHNNQEDKKNKSSLFSDATLDPITQRYIHSKYKLAEGEQNFANIDLRNMCENVVDELETLESEAAYDYLKVENEMKDLDVEIDKSDSILSELEKVLENFRDHLNEIKSQMTVLQERSLKMNISLTNRKNLQKLMNTFMDSAVLDPKLIDAINSAPIDQAYVQHIKVLCQKLEYLQNTKLPDASVVKELEPELNKLKNKACGRVRQFLLDKIDILKKPTTNIEIQQKNVLLDYRVFTEFLKCHYEEIYAELCNKYAEVMSKVYSQLFEKNVKELQKLWVELYNKSDTLVCDNASNMRIYITLKNGGKLVDVYPDKNKSIFDLMDRDLILKNERLNDGFIFYASASKENQRFTIEQIFRSMSKLILSTVVSEIAFSSQFFNLTNAQNSKIFKEIFSQTFKSLYNFLQFMLNESYDCNGMVLIILINEAYQREYSEMYAQSQVLQEYFNYINMLVWPRFEKVFEGHRQSISEKNLKQYKLLEKQFSFKVIVQRYADIIISFYKLYSYFQDNKMIFTRIELLRKDFINMIKKNAQDIGRGIDRCKYLLLIYDLIFTNIPTKKEYQKEITEIEKEQQFYINEFVNIFLKDLFGDMIDFINQNLKKEVSANKNNGEEIQDQKNYSQTQSNPADHERLVKTICGDFNSSRNKRIDTFKHECEKIFEGTQILKKILKRFLNTFIQYYGTFYRYCQQNHPQAAATLIHYNEINSDIQSSYGI
ncbi:hypothetical protein ABPG74_001079 [Tetrahymena malaccensis]